MAPGSQSKPNEKRAFTEHINSVGSNIEFAREDSEEYRLPFFDCVALEV